MLTSIDEAYARLTMLEYSLSLIMASNLTRFSPEDSTDCKVEFLSNLRGLILDRPLNPGEEMKEAEIAERVEQVAEHFIEKVSEMEQAMRHRFHG